MKRLALATALAVIACGTVKAEPQLKSNYDTKFMDAINDVVRSIDQVCEVHPEYAPICIQAKLPILMEAYKYCTKVIAGDLSIDEGDCDSLSMNGYLADIDARSTEEQLEFEKERRRIELEFNEKFSDTVVGQ